MPHTDLIAPRSLADPLPLTAWLDRIDAVDPVIHAFVPEPGRRDRLANPPAGPLSGVPVGVKDIFRVDGLPTLAGSTLPPEEFAGPEASVVTRLRSAGAVVAGKTVTAEFASVAPGPTVNPHDPAHTPGGSSSGSAAAVAAGMVPVALGSQTLGSVIRPAAFCGVVGFRPTHGRVPMDGMVPHSPSLDTVGWFTADVASAARIAAIICPTWTADKKDRPPVLGVPAPAYLAQADTAAQAAFQEHLDTLRRAGFAVRTTDFLSDVDTIGARMRAINRFELVRTHAAWFAEYGDRYRPDTVAALREGQAVTPDDYAAAVSWQQVFRARYADTGVDVWVTPAAPGTAPRGIGHTGHAVMSVPFSVAGAPAVCVPAGQDPRGLPWGVQLAGARGADERLLGWAAAIEGVLAQPL
ncbi:Asp-tRNA(Asn)/Glu-tRNA(Gln) amidotransferase A subunit family amidase [Asanoa ferruginea]|uniref:Asp-tRNA(Asn)/Glu-tRNA(Gln) amidotransferase A subunit family amidase n=1 Tax=Asanoa ferruginea TaxID=53367 RepID=A0A3D9ZRH4_9ACTN|nr:amidase [Asanoa ferruginea]REF99811.1 Asp-tRNA(Asn)/Glu-tRNA(Gln) amidotransferase A subunit family amidase [Asanoa ferruginea]GIF51829.1 amidase [Asanoa ferruginea]